MRRSLFATALLAASFTLLVPASAAAQRGGKVRLSSKQRREAKRLFDQGMLAYRRGDYEEAILRWQESYDISGHPLTFEAIANAYEKLDNYEAALEYLRKWRDKAPRREHEVLDARIQNYERQLAKQKRAEEEAAAERKRIEEEARLRAERERKEAERGLDPLPIAGWTLVGTGAAAVITGVALGGVAASRRPDEADACRQNGEQLLCSDDDRNAINSSNTLAIAGDALWIGGAALTAGGVVLLIVSLLNDNESEAKPGADKPAEPSAVWLPQLSPTSAGASLHIRF